jgi:anti-anti-sigma factor
MAKKSQPRNRVVLDGEWDVSRKDELRTLLSALTVDRPAIIDFRGVTFADSTVLGILAALRLKFQAVPITLLGAQPQVLKIFKIAGFDRLFRIVYDD